jgi:glutamine synthetase
MIMAESLEYAADRLEQLMRTGGADLNDAVQTLIQEIVKEHRAVIFNGDGYSGLWREEAQKRGLPCLRNAPEALGELISEASLALFARYEVLSKVELKARYEIYLEHYSNSIRTEANLCLRMARTIIYPAGVRYQEELARAALALSRLNRQPDTEILDAVSQSLDKLRAAADKLERETNRNPEGSLKTARHYGDVVLPLMDEVRVWADRLETLVAEDLWPLPSYQEMLFIK